MDVITGLRSLRATRSYTDAQVPPRLVESWLEAARWCGSSRNSQPWRFVVVRQPTTRAALAELGEFAAHLAAAPLVIVIAAIEGPYPLSTVFDLGRVAQSLMLAAHQDGFGSCVAVFEPASNIDRARHILGIPDSLRADLAIGFGVAATSLAHDRSGPSPRGRRRSETLVSGERYGKPLTPT